MSLTCALPASFMSTQERPFIRFQIRLSNNSDYGCSTNANAINGFPFMTRPMSSAVPRSRVVRHHQQAEGKGVEPSSRQARTALAERPGQPYPATFQIGARDSGLGAREKPPTSSDARSGVAQCAAPSLHLALPPLARPRIPSPEPPVPFPQLQVRVSHPALGAYETPLSTGSPASIQKASPTGFEPVISCLTGRRALPAAPRGRAQRIKVEGERMSQHSSFIRPPSSFRDQFRELESNQRCSFLLPPCAWLT
jgi:hypothetical protein